MHGLPIDQVTRVRTLIAGEGLPILQHQYVSPYSTQVVEAINKDENEDIKEAEEAGF